jgi:MscS family membrane protein
MGGKGLRCRGISSPVGNRLTALPFAAWVRSLLGVVVSVALVSSTFAAASDAGELDRHPLNPPDISSPRAALNTFIAEASAAVDAYYAGNIERMRARADRALGTLAADLPATDAGFLKAIESSLFLLEILIRVDLPAAAEIPGAETAPEQLPAYWRIPRTELRLVRVQGETGEFIGYRFSADTVERLPEFYQRVRSLPVRPGNSRYDGAVERFRLGPGFAAPAFVVSAVQGLPLAWFTSFAGEPLWKWAALALAAIGALGVFGLAYRVAARLDDGKRSTAWPTAVVRPLLAVSALGLLLFLRFAAVDVIRLTGTQRDWVVGLLSIFAHAAAIWLIFLVAMRVADAVIRGRDMGIYALDAQLVRLVSKLLALMLALYTIVDLAETLGTPVAPVLAGLGVSGLAVALAVRPTLENVVAGFVLFADAPVRVGEFCRFGEKMGTVEAIGLRSVRLRGIDRTLITVPNAEFCQLQLVNFTRRDAILLQSRLQLRHETTPDQLRLVLARLRELLIRHPMVSPDPARVRFVQYGESSLDLEIFAYVKTRDFSEFLAVQEDLNLRIKDVVERCGTGFAFPSRTLYVARNADLDAELAEAAATEVERWRRENRLPFPDFDGSTRSEMAGTLDYPPDGSPGRRRGAAAG